MKDNNRENRKIKLIPKAVFGLSLVWFFGAKAAQAVCPVCVVAVAGGLGLSEYLGIDDSIAGAWIGGLNVALIAWTLNWLDKKNWGWLSAKNAPRKTRRDIAITAAFYALLFWPLLSQDFIGNPGNQLFGIDKLLLGIGVGSFAFLGAVSWYENIKKKNNGHAWFPYQKIVWPVGALLIVSLFFYLLTR